MKKYITEYINYIDEIVKDKKYNKDIINEHLIKISFFQHERLIHLLVTLFYALIFIIFLVLISLTYLFVPIVIILFIFLLFYIRHYFYLENCVQYMYRQYDLMKKSDN